MTSYYRNYQTDPKGSPQPIYHIALAGYPWRTLCGRDMPEGKRGGTDLLPPQALVCLLCATVETQQED